MCTYCKKFIIHILLHSTHSLTNLAQWSESRSCAMAEKRTQDVCLATSVNHTQKYSQDIHSNLQVVLDNHKQQKRYSGMFLHHSSQKWQLRNKVTRLRIKRPLHFAVVPSLFTSRHLISKPAEHPPPAKSTYALSTYAKLKKLTETFDKSIT